MTFHGLFWTPKIPALTPGVCWFFFIIFFYWFSGQFMTFPGLLNFWPPKIPPGTTPLGSGGSIFLGSNLSHICPNMRVKFRCAPTVVNAMLAWQSQNVRKLRHPAMIATIFLARPSVGALVVRLITRDPIGISGVKYLCVVIRSLAVPPVALHLIQEEPSLIAQVLWHMELHGWLISVDTLRCMGQYRLVLCGRV